MLKIFSLFTILVFSLSGLAQGEYAKDPLTPNGGKVIIRGATPPTETVRPAQESPATVATPSPAAGSDILPTQEDHAVDELEKNRQKQMESYKKIDKAVEHLKDPILNPYEEIKKLGHKQIDAAALLDKRVIVILQKTFKDGLLTYVPEKEVRAMVLVKANGTFLESLFAKFPKLIDLSVDLLRDKHAFHGLLGILLRKEDLKTYGYMWLAIFIFGLFVKRRLVKPKWKFMKRFSWNMSINLILSSISLFLFYEFFYVEITPTLNVIFKYL
jgi:hypothetical protein